MELARQVDQFLSQITQFAENKHEILLGACESGEHLTSTQEHILMLLENQQTLTNARIAENLKISPAAVTKAIKKLQEQNLLEAHKTQADAREVELSLTDKARPIAKEHASHHAKTLQTYQQILEKFDDEQQATIKQFLSALTEVLE